MTEKLSVKFVNWAATGYSLKRCLERTQGVFAQEIVARVHNVQESRRGLTALWKPQSTLFGRNRHTMKKSHRYYKSTQRVSKQEMESLLAVWEFMRLVLNTFSCRRADIYPCIIFDNTGKSCPSWRRRVRSWSRIIN